MYNYEYQNAYAKRYFAALSIVGVYFGFIVLMLFVNNNLEFPYQLWTSIGIYLSCCVLFYLIFFTTGWLLYWNTFVTLIKIIVGVKTKIDFNITKNRTIRVICDLLFFATSAICDFVILYDAVLYNCRVSIYNTPAQCALFAQAFAMYPGIWRTPILVLIYLTIALLAPLYNPLCSISSLVSNDPYYWQWLKQYAPEVVEAMFIAAMSLLRNYFYWKFDKIIYQYNIDIQTTTTQLQVEIEKNDRLTRDIIPLKFVESVKDVFGKKDTSEPTLNFYMPTLYVIVLDCVLFTNFCKDKTASVITETMDAYFSAFDGQIKVSNNIWKIKQVGDAMHLCMYHEFNNLSFDAVKLGRKLLRLAGEVSKTRQTSLDFRCGVAKDEGCAMIIGKKMINFDVIGKAKMKAELLESKAQLNHVNVCEEIHADVCFSFNFSQSTMLVDSHNPNLICTGWNVLSSISRKHMWKETTSESSFHSLASEVAVTAPEISPVSLSWFELCLGLVKRKNVGEFLADLKDKYNDSRVNLLVCSMINVVYNIFIMGILFLFEDAGMLGNEYYHYWVTVGTIFSALLVITAFLWLFTRQPYVSIFLSYLTVVPSIAITAVTFAWNAAFQKRLVLFSIMYFNMYISEQISFTPFEMMMLVLGVNVPFLTIFDMSLISRISSTMMFMVLLTAKYLITWRWGLSKKVQRVYSEREVSCRKEIDKNRTLLCSFLPNEFIEHISKNQIEKCCQKFEAAVMFVNVVGFYNNYLRKTANLHTLVCTLHTIFGKYDDEMQRYKTVQKVKSNGDQYIFYSPSMQDLTDYALSIRALVRPHCSLRIGIYYGEIVATIVGKLKYAFDIFGSPVNATARLANAAPIDKILIMDSTAGMLPNMKITPYNLIDLKGIGEVKTSFVERS